MNKFFKAAALAGASFAAIAMSSAANAADKVNVAFFLEWATPNQIAKVDKAYDQAMGVDVNWTDFSTGVAMTEAMLAGDIDIAYSQGLAPFVTAIQQGAPLKMVGIAVVYEANDCFVKNGLGIDSSNASELEGKTVALAAACQFSTRPPGDSREWQALLSQLATHLSIPEQALRSAASSVRVLPEEELSRIPQILRLVSQTMTEIGRERLKLVGRLRYIAQVSQV